MFNGVWNSKKKKKENFIILNIAKMEESLFIYLIVTLFLCGKIRTIVELNETCLKNVSTVKITLLSWRRENSVT